VRLEFEKIEGFISVERFQSLTDQRRQDPVIVVLGG